jgi:hypothetical protein
MFDDKDEKICPSCGNKVEAGATTCGFCGASLTDGDQSEYRRPRSEFQRLSPPDNQEVPVVASGGGVNLGGGVGSAPSSSPVPSSFYATTEGVVAAGTGWIRWVSFLVVLVVIGIVAVPLFLVMRQVDDAFEAAPGIDLGGPGDIGGAGAENPVRLEGAYKNGRSFVFDLKANGVKCTNLDVATRNAFVEAGVCYVKGDPVNYQLYFDPTALNGVLGSIRNLKRNNVVHEANWLAMAPTSRRAARDIKKAIGGKLE